VWSEFGGLAQASFEGAPSLRSSARVGSLLPVSCFSRLVEGVDSHRSGPLLRIEQKTASHSFNSDGVIARDGDSSPEKSQAFDGTRGLVPIFETTD
jgi:hypothetical protein